MRSFAKIGKIARIININIFKFFYKFQFVRLIFENLFGFSFTYFFFLKIKKRKKSNV